MCRMKGCSRPVFADGLCGFHALQRYYRTEASKDQGLVAARVPGPPRVVIEDAPGPPEPAGRDEP
jgi:hypothetical protein